MTALLDATQLRIAYGVSTAVHDVSFEVHTGQILALLGANGAGKSSILRTIAGLVTPAGGSVLLDGKHDLGGLTAHEVTRLGVSLVPEGRRVLADMTVLENLELGAYTRDDEDAVQESLDDVFQRFPRLRDRSAQLAGTLSGGEQQMLAIGRSLMSKPRLLVCDELSLGLAPLIVADLFTLLSQLREEGMTIIIAEQNARLALRHSDQAIVLEAGEVVLRGPSDEVSDDPAIRAAYLGGRASSSGTASSSETSGTGE